MLLAGIGVQVSGIFVDFPKPIVFTGFPVAAKRELPRHGMRQKILGRIEHATRFQEQYLQTVIHQYMGGRGPSRSGANHNGIVHFPCFSEVGQRFLAFYTLVTRQGRLLQTFFSP